MKIQLQINSQGVAERVIELAIGIYRLGGHADCDVPLIYPTISRNHGLAIVSESGVFYRDENSRNGSFMNSLRLESQSDVVWPETETIQIGPYALKWRKQVEQPRTEIEHFAALYSRLLAEKPLRAKELLYDELGKKANGNAVFETIHHEFHGDGPLRAYWNDAHCREILINAFDEIHVDTGSGLYRVPEQFLNRQTFEAWAIRTAHEAGRRLDLQHPICEATLSSGARFHAVMAPVSARGLSVAIRRFGSAPRSEQDALESGWIAPAALRILKSALVNKLNIVVSGGTSTGKTSLLNFLCQYLDPQERVITIEDTVELAPPVKNLVQLQARTANADGVGTITLRQLVQCALRMRPDRIIVGECRGAEVLEMLQALNTGHPGSLTTLHANSTGEALERLELLALLGAGNLSLDCIRQWTRGSINMVVQVERDPGGRRHISQIAERIDGQFQNVYHHKVAPSF